MGFFKDLGRLWCGWRTGHDSWKNDTVKPPCPDCGSYWQECACGERRYVEIEKGDCRCPRCGCRRYHDLHDGHGNEVPSYFPAEPIDAVCHVCNREVHVGAGTVTVGEQCCPACHGRLTIENSEQMDSSWFVVGTYTKMSCGCGWHWEGS